MISAGLFSSILFFVIAIGVLVTFHEFGHYWVARKLNVKVLRFSIGFGKPLLTVRRRHGDDEIEYVIAAIPLGGYVKMLDEREAPVELHNKHRAFNNQPILKRAAIVAAGPIFNFILAIFLYWIVLLNGEDGRRPVIFPAENSLAMQAGFSTEDEILAVGTVAVTTWQAFRLELIDQGIDGGKLPIQVRTAKNELLTHVLNIGERHLLAKQDDVTDQLGFSLWQPVLEPVIGDLEDHGAAQRAGLQRHDKILAVDGDATAEWPDVVKHIQAGANQTLMFSIERNGVKQDVNIIPNVRSQNGKSVGYIGAGLYVPEEIINKLTVHIDYTVFDAASNALAKTWSSSQLILRVGGNGNRAADIFQRCFAE